MQFLHERYAAVACYCTFSGDLAIHTYTAVCVQLCEGDLLHYGLTREYKALWSEPKEVPSSAIVAHIHAFAWDPNWTRTG